jgi:translation initiation factor 3 subunit L
MSSFENYRKLFKMVLDREIMLEKRISLPSSWLYDMIDEFIYQFQSFAHYRLKLKSKDEEELSMLQDVCEGGTWDCATVFQQLESLVNDSNIIAFLDAEEERAGNLQNVELDLFKMLGYFGVIGLLRMHCLTADYRRALQQLDRINIARRGLLKGGMPAHITTYYYMGFAYMMHRRYVDSIKALSNILLYINRTKQYHTRSSSYDVILKKNEQMFALLALLVSVCPYKLEENLQGLLHERNYEKIAKMQKGDLTVYDELFTFACPKFVELSTPDYTCGENLNQAATKHQCTLFMKQVQQSAMHPTIRSFLKLYTTIPTNKLATFLGWSDDELVRHVACLKHKSRELVWNGGSATSGIWASSSDVEFYLDEDMVHVNDPKVVKQFDEFFIKHINKFDEIINDLNR